MVVIKNKGTNRRSKYFFAKPGWHTAETVQGKTSCKFSSKGSSWLLVYGTVKKQSALIWEFGPVLVQGNLNLLWQWQVLADLSPEAVALL